jgi:hypothetical protein
MVASLALSLGACAQADLGVSYGNVHCGSDRSAETAVFDYAADAVGHATIAGAIEAFRDLGPIWQLRDDWHALEQGDTSSSPVSFTDRNGWVYLSVDLVRLNDSWLVGGYTSCSPSGS